MILSTGMASHIPAHATRLSYDMLCRILLSVALALPSVQAAQPGAAEPIAAPLRDLPWNQLNFLHTTDIHGWHAGHLQE